MVGRIRDFHGRVINPKDHFVLPNKRKLSRSDVKDLLSDQSVWRGNKQIQPLIPQLLDYMVSPWKGTPTVAGKLHGGAFNWSSLSSLFNNWIDDESGANDRTPAMKRKRYKNDHSTDGTVAPFKRGNFKPTFARERDPSTKRRKNFDQDHSATPSPYTPTSFSYPPSNDPYTPNMNAAPPLVLGAPARPPPPAAPAPPVPPSRHGATARPRTPPPAAPEPPAPPPVPPLNVPVYPVASNDRRSPFSKLIDEAMRLNLSAVVKKLYVLVGNNRAHTFTLQQVVTATGLSDDEVQLLTSIPTNHLFGQHDNTTISSNGIPVVHVHNSKYQPFSGPPRPLMIKTNSGTSQIKVR